MTDQVPGAAGAGSTQVESAASDRELDQLFLLHASALEAGEAVARWWFDFGAEAQDALSAEALDDLLRNALQGIAHALDADAVAVLIADEASGELVARAAIGMQPEMWREVHIAFGAGMAGRVAARRTPWIVPDLSKIEVVSETLRDSGVRSLVAVPIVIGGHVIGVVHADSFELDHFGPREERLLQVVADRLGAVIERVRLFQAEQAARSDAEAAAERLGRLQRITASLSGDLDVDRVAEVVLSELAPAFGPGTNSHTIWHLEGDRLRLLRAWEAGAEANVFAEMSIDDDLPGPFVARTNRALWLGSRDELLAFPELRKAEINAEAVAVLPLAVDAEMLGVLAIGYDRPREFGPEERNFLSIAALQAAQALHRARLRAARARAAADNAFVADISAVLASSLEVPTTVARAVRMLVPRLADMATVHLFDDLGMLQRMAVAHRDPALESDLRASGPGPEQYEAQTALLTMAAAAGESILLPAPGTDMAADTALDAEHELLLRELGITSAIAVPLRARGEELGLLGLMRLDRSPPYGELDVELAAEVGRRTSQALDNAMQHQRRVEVARALQASLLPPALMPVPGVEVAAVFHPATAGVDVGGDFYDLFPLSDERWVLMIGDVSGSGPAAAALTAQVRHGARVAARAGLEPAAVVAAVNATLDETTGSEWFCTMVYAELVPHDDGVDMQVICAGHPPPIVLRGDHVEEVEAQGPLLGVMPSASFPARRLRLGPGHALVLVTDGATEARQRGRHGLDSFFGEARLAAALVGSAGQSAAGIVEAISTEVLAFTGGQLNDDMALVALRATPGER